MKVKTAIQLLLATFLFLLPVSKTLAAEPMLSFYPEGGVVSNPNDGFILDVLVDSGGEDLTSARFVITFDPSILQIQKAERNNSLFEQWPNDESTLDNDNGVVMLTGFTQSGSSDLYTTEGDPDVMARLTFEVVKEGNVTFDWEFSGSDDNFKSYLLKDGSPPQNVLDTKPSSVTFQIGDVVYNPGSVNTGLSVDKYVLATGLVLILFGGLMVFSRPSNRLKKGKGTIILEPGS
jgi:hypothetical protein